MTNAWDELRVKNHIATHGEPINPQPRYKARMEFVAKHITGSSMLDVACGTGHLYPYIGHRYYKGIDSSPHMIETAKHYFPDVMFAVGDAYDLSNESYYCTVVAMSLLIHIHQDATETIINELWKQTKRVLLFTIPIDKDFTKIAQLSRKVSGACGKTLITHVSHETLDEILEHLYPEKVYKLPFEEGSFGFGLNDYLMKVIKE